MSRHSSKLSSPFGAIQRRLLMLSLLLLLSLLLPGDGVIATELTDDESASQLEGSADFGGPQLHPQQLAGSLAISATGAVSQPMGANLQCERIAFSFCASMPYNYTRMPNFFADANQVEAAERAQQYELLARTQCSRHLLAYLCELLAPMCLDGEAMKKFEIFPCRSFCRQVRRDCEHHIEAIFQLVQFARPLPAAFACDQLPYETNGGDGAHLRGPCHETPLVSDNHVASPPLPPINQLASHQHNQQQQANFNSQPGQKAKSQAYWPYKNELDANVPPFITDNSPIDSRIIRPVVQQAPADGSSGQSERADENSSATWHQLQTWAQQLALLLLRHSNLLSILTLVCLLLLLLNAKRLKRLKAQLLPATSSRKSSSSNSSSGSQRKLAATSGSKTMAATGGSQKLSPSSSSRSLMLMATGEGKLTHKLLEPSRKLIQQHNQRTTLINLNGTLERQQLARQEEARYHLMQSLAGDHQLIQQHPQQQHQYDYIQVGGEHEHQRRHYALEQRAQRATSMNHHNHNHNHNHHLQQQQGGESATKLYSNILLSSPSHQVLLFGQQQQQQQQSGYRAHHGERGAGAPPPPSSLPPPLQSAPNQMRSLANGGERSFQRRPSLTGSQMNGSLSTRHRRAAACELQKAGGDVLLVAGPYASPSVSTSAASESAASSASSSFSPPSSLNKPTATRLSLGAGQR